MRILMVCLGNICRSPLAEGILRDKTERRKLHWQIDSAGTGNWHIGEPPHPLSQRIARIHGVDISRLRGRQFCREDILRFDHIYVMDRENYADVKYICGPDWDAGKVDLILNTLSQDDKQVPDPWFDNTLDAFEEVYQMLDKACEQIIAKSISRSGEK